MKFDTIKAVIVVALSALLAYGLYNWCVSDNKVLLAVVSFLGFSVTLVAGSSISVPWLRSMANARVIAILFFICFLILDIVFSKTLSFSVPTFVVIQGVLLLMFLLIEYTYLKGRKEE